MLVLTRKTDQEIVIGDNIRITVLKSRGNTVRLGISAPRDVSVMRGELETFRETAAEACDSEPAGYTLVFENEATSGDRVDQSRDSSRTVSFRGELPRSLQRNRLQEIAAQISSENAKPR